MQDTTLCYIERDDKYLMLYRNKKKNDLNAGKWIGVGGKVEPGETPEECVIRETFEETGLTLKSVVLRGVIMFYSDVWEDEVMYLYSATDFEGEIFGDCNEGDLKWIPKDEIMDLSLWEGDRIFLKDMLEGKMNIYMSLYYEGDALVEIKSEAYRIGRIDEPDFGCEGRPDGYIQQDKVWLISATGEEKVISVPESVLVERDLDEGDYIVLNAEGHIIVSIHDEEQ